MCAGVCEGGVGVSMYETDRENRSTTCSSEQCNSIP